MWIVTQGHKRVMANDVMVWQQLQSINAKTSVSVVVLWGVSWESLGLGPRWRCLRGSHCEDHCFPEIGKPTKKKINVSSPVSWIQVQKEPSSAL